MDNSVYGWHIVLVDENGTPYLSRDLEHIEAYAGLTISMPREDVVGIAADGTCGAGLYMSILPSDALKYAPNGKITICRVSTPADAIVQEDEGKLVTTERTVIAMLDAEKTHHVLVGWVMRRAEQALALVDNPDPCSVEALATVKRWMEGEATQEELEAATRAATYAARVAARAATDAADAAYAATRAATYAARVAARAATDAADAAYAATRAATYAARVAARAATDAADAAYAAAHAATYATHAATYAARVAARVAARAATDAAVRAKQNEQLESMLLAAMGLS